LLVSRGNKRLFDQFLRAGFTREDKVTPFDANL